MRPFSVSGIALLAVAAAGATLPAAAQREVGVPFRQDAYVLRFAPPHAAIRLDLGETTLTEELVVEARVPAGATAADARGRPLPLASVRAGLEVTVEGERLRSGFVVSAIRLKTRLEDDGAEVAGVFERLQGDTAVVGGQRAVLPPGSAVQGDAAWRGRSFRSFDEMMLGSFVTLKGSRGPDGVLRVREGRTRPNDFTGMERELHAALSQSLVVPARLAGGTLTVAGTQYPLANSAPLQAYVTRVGMRLVPRWMQALPADDPARINFRFFVVQDSTFNAAAYPDGTVVVHTGLLRAVRNEAQLAGVLGHEIAHVTHEHTRLRMEGGQRRQAVGGLLRTVQERTGVDVPTVRVGGREVNLGALARFGADALSNVHSREHESQADRVGLFYMVEAGYDPREAAALWRDRTEATRAGAGAGNAVENVLRRVDDAQRRVAGFLYGSHPESMARARNLNREIAAGYGGLDFARLRVGADEYRRAVAGLR
jgi:Zn-dependent protease with chaperone function